MADVSFRALLDAYTLSCVLYCEQDPDDESTLNAMNEAGDRLTNFFITKTGDVMHNATFRGLLGKYTEYVFANGAIRESQPCYLDSSDRELEEVERNLTEFVDRFCLPQTAPS